MMTPYLKHHTLVVDIDKDVGLHSVRDTGITLNNK